MSGRIGSFCLLSLIVFLAIGHAHAITTFTVNGQTELDVVDADSVLFFEADVAQPGGALALEFYADANGNGLIDPGLDANLLAYFQPWTIRDGGDGYPSDLDGVVNGLIKFEAEPSDILPGFPTVGLIMRLTDGDGSSAQVVVHATEPGFTQSIAGQVVSSTGEPLPGVLVLVVSRAVWDAEPLSYPGDVCLPFQSWSEPDPAERVLPPPMLAVTNESGQYSVSVDVGESLVQVLPKPGYYIPREEETSSPLEIVDTQVVPVAADAHVTDIDFVLLEDSTPPTINHDPLMEFVPYEEVILTAHIIDDESGVQMGGSEFLLARTAPTVFCRPVGSNEPFRHRMMFPATEWDEPYPKPDEPTDVWEDGLEIAPAPREGTSVGAASSEGLVPNSDGIGADLTFPRYDDWGGLQTDDFSAVLTNYDLNADAIEYYMVAYDRAGNMATSPANAPATLYHLERIPSDFTISGHIRTADDAGLGGVSINGTSVDLTGDYTVLWTQSRADGSYVLPVPSQGIWQVTATPLRQYYFEDASGATTTVTVVRPGDQDGVDFTLVEDTGPPVIVHDPETDVMAQSAGDDVQIRAVIHDDSGHAYATVMLVSLNTPLLDEYGMDEIPGLPITEIKGREDGEDPNEWIFTIPGELVRRDFGYSIIAWDLAGNRTSHPEEGTEAPHTIHLEPAPYQIAGVVTDVNGNPAPGIDLYFTTMPLDFPSNNGEIPELPELDLGDVDIDGVVDSGIVDGLISPDVIDDISVAIRYARTDDEGRYSVPVKPGVWHVRFERYGLVLAETPEPVTVTAEGEYELDLVVVVDDQAPVIVHTPAAEFVFGDAMMVQATVEDNADLDRVWVALYHTMPDYADLMSLVEPNDAEDGDVAVPACGSCWAWDEIRGAEDGEAFDEFLTEFRDSVSSWNSGEYCTYVPMHTTDGIHYEADLWHHVIRNPVSSIEQVQYVVCAVDVAGNSSISPEDAPSVRHSVPVTIPQSVTGQISIDEIEYGGFDTIVVQLITADGTVLWTRPDDEGLYRFPAAIGENAVSVEFHPGYSVAPPREVMLGAGQHADGIDFDLQSRILVPVRPRERWSDVNDDGSVDILDLVQIGQHFGETVDLAESPPGTPSPDTNGDGTVDILDLVSVGQAFGTRFDQASAPSLMSTIDIPVSIVPLTRGNGMATVALQVDAGTPIAGIQFSLHLQSDQATLLNVSKGSMLDSGASQSFWLQPELRDNAATAAINVALKPVGVRQASGQFAVLTLGLADAGMVTPAEVSLDSLVLVTKDGERLSASVQPIGLDLESLILPEHNALLSNYPNPFNPETWIPYQLAQDADVRLQIFDSAGRLIRSLGIGHQEAGIYANRSRAAYWDGKNNQGEKVASGVYFYSLQAGNYHAVRRMLITK